MPAEKLAALARGTLARTRPTLQQAAGGLRRALEAWVERATGPDFDRRMAALEARYAGRADESLALDPATARRALELLAILHRFWFRSEVFGIEQVPEGRVLLVANHSGQLPLDACMLAAALVLDRDPPRFVRALVDRWAEDKPLISDLLARTGQVIGLPENGRRLLEDEECVLVFPEGVRGVSKPLWRRYKLEPFGSGFARLAMETAAPVVPVGIVGAEEQYLSVGNLRWAARVLRLPSFPVMPQLIVPGGQLPLPTRYRVHFGAPRRLEGDASDPASVELAARSVREAVESLVAHGLKERRAVFW